MQRHQNQERESLELRRKFCFLQMYGAAQINLQYNKASRGTLLQITDKYEYKLSPTSGTIEHRALAYRQHSAYSLSASRDSAFGQVLTSPEKPTRAEAGFWTLVQGANRPYL